MCLQFTCVAWRVLGDVDGVMTRPRLKTSVLALLGSHSSQADSGQVCPIVTWLTDSLRENLPGRACSRQDQQAGNIGYTHLHSPPSPGNIRNISQNTLTLKTRSRQTDTMDSYYEFSRPYLYILMLPIEILSCNFIIRSSFVISVSGWPPESVKSGNRLYIIIGKLSVCIVLVLVIC